MGLLSGRITGQLSEVVPGVQGGIVSLNGLKGTTDGVTIGAGYIGEVVTESRIRSAAVSLTSLTAANVTSTALTLQPGRYRLYGAVGITFGATTSVTEISAAISTTSATLPPADTVAVQDSNGQVRSIYSTPAVVPIGDLQILQMQSYINISTSTTYYLIARATFTVSTAVAYGAISAERIA